MITEICLRNFRCWRELGPLACRPITVLFGANSSGKTTMLHSLLALKQTAETYDRKRAFNFGGGPRDLVDLGSYREVVFGHKLQETVSVSVVWEALAEAGATRAWHEHGLRYDAEWRLAQGEVVLSYLHYSWRRYDFSMRRRDDGKYEPGVGGMTRRMGRPWPLDAPPESCYALPRRADREVENFDLLDFNHQFELLAGRLHYLGPLRDRPERAYAWTGEAPQSVGPDGEDAIRVLLAAERQREDGPKRRRSPPGGGLAGATQEWLRRLELAREFGVRGLDRDGRFYEVRLRLDEGGPDAALPDVGFGVSQVLPVIVSPLFVPEGSIVLLEHPELHLHPRAQAGLADLFLQVAAQRHLQLIIESHSEHLLRRLQRRIAEAETPLATPDGVALYFCSMRNGEAHAEPVEVDEYGTIANWPEGFFGDEVADLEAMARARLRRQREAQVG